MTKNSYKYFFKALGNETRLAIVSSLREGPKNVGQICRTCDLEQSVVSHSLRILHATGIVSQKREGKRVVYSLESKDLMPIFSHIDRFLEKSGQNVCTCGILEGRRKCKHLKVSQ
jgi:DNA-binding transcriptional ArsR family regulator